MPNTHSPPHVNASFQIAVESSLARKEAYYSSLCSHGLLIAYTLPFR